MSENTWSVMIDYPDEDVQEGDILGVPEAILERLGAQDHIKLKVGSYEREVRCQVIEQENELHIPAHIMHEIGLNPQHTYHLTADTMILRFGPVIGVIVGPTYIERLYNRQKPKPRTMELIKANEDVHTMLFFFSIENVFLEQARILGTYYSPLTERWEQTVFPFPDVLYDRGNRRKRYSPANKQFRHLYDHLLGFKKINARHSFDKWDLHKKLYQYKEMRKYLPQTKLYKKKVDFKPFIGSNQIYIKRCVSSNGRKVMRISKIPKQGFQYSYYENKVVAKKVRTFDDVVKKMDDFFHGKKVIIQQAIDLKKINNNIVDLRATLQRNGRGELETTAIAARVAGKKSPVTSTRTGSTCYPFEDFYRTYYNYSTKQIKKLRERIEKFLKITYECIEKAYGDFGEMGIDFALDQDEMIWLIEANATPAKEALYKSYDKNTIQKAFRNPLEYAKYISGF